MASSSTSHPDQPESLKSKLTVSNDEALTVKATVTNIDDQYTEYESKGTTRRYFTIQIADETTSVDVRIYQTKLLKTLRLGKSYIFTNASFYQHYMIFFLQVVRRFSLFHLLYFTRLLENWMTIHSGLCPQQQWSNVPLSSSTHRPLTILTEIGPKIKDAH